MKTTISKRIPKRPPPLFYLLFAFVMSWAVFLLVEVFRGQLYVVMPAETYLTIHIIAELFSIIVSFSIFGLGWFTYRQSKNNYTLFLGIAFFGIGALDLIHTLSFPGMPDLLTPSSTDKGIQFWLAARIFGAIAFLVSAFIMPTAKKTLPRKSLLVGVVLLAGLYFVWVAYEPAIHPVYFVPGEGLTAFKVFMEYVVIAISLATLLAYYFRYRRTQDQLFIWFMCALVLTIFGELAFTLYKSAYDTFNLLGHVYKVAAFILIYRGVFIASASESYRRLEQSEKEFSTAFMDSPTLMAITDPATGKIKEINGAFCEFFGYKRSELIGSSTVKLNLWADPKQRDEVIKQLDKDGQARNVEISLRTKSGDLRYALDSMDYIYLDDRKYLLSVAIDITQRKQAEQSLKESQQELKKTIESLKKDEQHIKDLSELRAKFIQIISHQLRTPLGSIRWTIQSLLDGSLGKLTDAQKQFLGLAYSADVTIINRVNDLLTTIDIEEGRVSYNKKMVSMDSLVKSVVTEMEPHAREKKLSFAAQLPKKPLPPVFVDAPKIRSAIEKIVENSIIFTPKNGKITLSLKLHGPNVRVEVADTGIGIPKAEQQHVFESFFRASNAFLVEPNASGVGLPIAKHFVEKQGGSIGFTSKESKGSTFWLELPIAKSRK